MVVVVRWVVRFYSCILHVAKVQPSRRLRHFYQRPIAARFEDSCLSQSFLPSENRSTLPSYRPFRASPHPRILSPAGGRKAELISGWQGLHRLSPPNWDSTRFEHSFFPDKTKIENATLRDNHLTVLEIKCCRSSSLKDSAFTA